MHSNANSVSRVVGWFGKCPTVWEFYLWSPASSRVGGWTPGWPAAHQLGWMHPILSFCSEKQWSRVECKIKRLSVIFVLLLGSLRKDGRQNRMFCFWILNLEFPKRSELLGKTKATLAFAAAPVVTQVAHPACVDLLCSAGLTNMATFVQKAVIKLLLDLLSLYL